MGSYRTRARLSAPLFLVLAAVPASAERPGWHYSPLTGEGDRATLGCDREANDTAFTCLAVRCEDNYSVGVYVHSNRADDTGIWDMTLDREPRELVAGPAGGAPYGGRFTADDAAWLVDRIRHGTFVYLRPLAASGQPYAFIDLSGSFYAVNEALAWCAPRLPAAEPMPPSGVVPPQPEENNHGPSPARPQ